MKYTPQNPRPLSIRDFAKKIICDGHLLLPGREGRKFHLMKPGVLVDPAFIKKHAPHNTVFEYDPVIDEDIKRSFLTLFKELRYLQFEKDLRMKSVEILRLFEEVYSQGHHFLNFALAVHEEFCTLSREMQVKMHETDVYLYRKALYSSAFAVIIAIGNDFYHHPLLKDFYNLTLALDIGLCESSYSYYVAQACNQENQRPGSGQAWMISEKASEAELKVFLEHPEKSYEFLKGGRDLLAHKELAEVALYQHELSGGGGFPRGISKGLISSWESVVVLADSLVEIQDEYDFETKVLDFVFSFQNAKLSDLPVGKVYKKFCHGLLYFTKMKETAT